MGSVLCLWPDVPPFNRSLHGVSGPFRPDRLPRPPVSRRALPGPPMSPGIARGAGAPSVLDFQIRLIFL